MPFFQVLSISHQTLRKRRGFFFSGAACCTLLDDTWNTGMTLFLCDTILTHLHDYLILTSSRPVNGGGIPTLTGVGSLFTERSRSELSPVPVLPALRRQPPQALRPTRCVPR